MHLGLILTSAPSVAFVATSLEAARADALKIVPAWGLPWTPVLIREVAALPKALVVRSTWGDPSYANGARALPLAQGILEEIGPWLVARPDAWIEIGNEPLLEDQADEQIAWRYRWHLDQTITALRSAYPHARLIAPAHTRNHSIRLGAHANGQSRWDEICADQYRRCDALGLHAYSAEQLALGLSALKRDVSAGMPIWLTEFALNEELPAYERGWRYRELLRDAPVDAALLYHLAESPGDDPIHFNPRYQLSVLTLHALHQERPMTERDVRADLARYRTETLKRGDWQIGTRSKTTAITLHWNGPAVPASRQSGEGAYQQLRIDTEWQTRPGWGGSPRGGDGLQYHAAVDAAGVVWHCRDLQAKLWHCGHAAGNAESLSLHLLLGRGQNPTEAQWSATLALLEHWRGRYGIPLARVFGHQEWVASDCPGPVVMERLRAYRAGASVVPPPPPHPVGLRRFVVDLPASASATVRQGPSRAYPIAAHLRPGTRLWVSPVLLSDEAGEVIAGERRWAHLANVPDVQGDVGFVHLSALRELL